MDYLGRPYRFPLIQKIRELVIDARVLKDCDIVGGEQVLIELNGVMPQWVEPHSAVYHVPKALTRGRSITTALIDWLWEYGCCRICLSSTI